MQSHLKMIQDLVDKIEEDVAYDVNIKKLAHINNMSPWHFQRLFKSIVGDTLGNYTRGRRLSLSANMLLETELSIIDIAFNVGFTSHESFSRSFKNYFKYSPKDFRNIKPLVLINKKPLLSNELLEHIIEGMHQEPEIINKDEQIIVGMQLEIPSPFSTRDNICEYVAPYWFKLFEEEKNIENRIIQTYYAVNISPSGNFTEEKINYIAAAPVSTLENIPEGMSTYTIPKQKVAIFNISTDIDSETAKKTIDYIYGYWLPNSKYKRGIGNDYELFENVIDFNDGSFSTKYVIPITE
ncbi:AraC family transcriptional regulator [Poseidonibacter lekithochrous]|uniref:AraC family transcriptional regulator n=1 Tax=Poseidonibacter lekithochrous TaxID=1904463 RepID=UPI0013DB75F1|nr:AraC family transcriptional regulator [Poseidonibacter lekithochrous]